MEVFDTFVFMKISCFFQNFWIDTNGKIFLVTLLAYSASYMVYSGYISWFAGGYGGLLLSQVGFTAIDFLTLIPASFLLLFESMKALVKFAIKYTLFYFALPLLLLVLFLTISTNWETHSFSYGSTLTVAGFIIWLIGAFLGLNIIDTNKKLMFQLSLLFICLGTLLFSIFLPLSSGSIISPTPGSSSQPAEFNPILEFTVLLYLLLIMMLPFLAGQWMGQLAAKEKLLSRLTKIVLRQAVDVPGMRQMEHTMVEASSTRFDGFIGLFKPRPKAESQTYAYLEDPNNPIYLIASFNRITALYIPPEILNSRRGKMIVLSNDLIYSMEIQGRKSAT